VKLMAEFMLTTVDNPYDPFTQFNEWRVWDESRGYHTLSLLARVTRSSPELSDEDQKLAIEQGMDEIVSAIVGVYRKVSDSPKNEATDKN